MSIYAGFLKKTRNTEPLCCPRGGFCFGTLSMIYTLILTLSRLQLFITKLVPFECPSQKAITRSEYSIMVIFRFNEAERPYFLCSGRNSVSLILCDRANFLVQEFIPTAPPEMISSVFGGRYFPKSFTVRPP